MSGDAERDASDRDEMRKLLRSELERLAPDALLTFGWDEFYNAHNHTIRGLARHVGVSEDRVSTFVRHVWLAILPKLAAYPYNPNRSGMRAWLVRTVREVTAALLRSQGLPSCVIASRGRTQQYAVCVLRARTKNVTPDRDPN